MLKSRFDAIMEQRSTQLIEQIGEWLPSAGPALDLGSGTGHLSARLERELRIEIVPADVCDIHVMGPPPVIITEGELPFNTGKFSAALLIFMLHYPSDPVALLAEAARVTDGPVILVQSIYAGRFGYLWLRAREFVWTYVAFHVSKVIGYVPSGAKFTMSARRFYTSATLERDLVKAGLRIGARRERSVLPGGALVVAGWMLERNSHAGPAKL